MREAEIVDGQQRITTMMLTYAALQYQLHQKQAAAPGDARAAIEAIASRLRFDDGSSRGYGLVLHRVVDDDAGEEACNSEALF